jgi:methyltransferase-like protein
VGLQFLSEADVSDMMSSAFPAPVAETLERISQDILHLEQYMDFVRNRQFRQTVLCHKSVRPKRALTPAFMHGLMASCRAVTEAVPPDLASTGPVVFSNGLQRAEVSQPATKAAFMVLMEAFPQAIDVDELCAIAVQRAAPFLADTTTEAARRLLMSDLFWGVMRGMIRLHTVAPACTSRASDRPRASALAAYLAKLGKVVVNARHEMIEVQTLGLEVLKLANGQRTRAEILEVLSARAASGAMTVSLPGQAEMEPEAAQTVLGAELERTIASLTRSAVLVA